MRKRAAQVVVLAMLAAIVSFAADPPGLPPTPAAPSIAFIATLRNGFSIRYERREARDGVARLFVSGESYVDVPEAEIAGIGPEEVGPQPPAATLSLDQLVEEAGGRHQLDPDFLDSVVRAESGYNPRAVSPKGAQGLMQLMPRTAAGLGVPDAFEPAANLEGGVRYLRELLRRYGNDPVRALAAYNAGPQRVQQYGGVPPYRETRAYVSRIVREFNQKKLAEKKPAVVPRPSAAKTAAR